MKLKKILKSKRGLALENAIIFMLLIFSLCALLSSLTLVGHYEVKIENMLLRREVEIDQIGEDYLASVKAGSSFEKVYENYSYEVSGNALTVWSKKDESKKAVLYVEAALADGQLSVINWRYSLPEETE